MEETSVQRGQRWDAGGNVLRSPCWFKTCLLSLPKRGSDGHTLVDLCFHRRHHSKIKPFHENTINQSCGLKCNLKKTVLYWSCQKCMGISGLVFDSFLNNVESGWNQVRHQRLRWPSAQLLLLTPLLIITAAVQRAPSCPLHPPVLRQSCPTLTLGSISLIRGISRRRRERRRDGEADQETSRGRRKGNMNEGESLWVCTFHLTLLIFKSCLSELPLRPVPPARSHVGFMMNHRRKRSNLPLKPQGALTADTRSSEKVYDQCMDM